MSELEKMVLKISSVLLVVFQPLAFSWGKTVPGNAFIDPEVQFYFESTVGYRKLEKTRDSGFRDSPISAPAGTGASKPSFMRNEPPRVFLPAADYKKPNFDHLPLYYDLKIADTAGPISSCVLEPSSSNEAVASRYVMVDITIKGEDSAEFYRDFMKKIDFFMAGEQDLKEDGKPWKIVFGWISYESLERLRASGLIKGFSFSRRPGLRAPMKDVALVIKVPGNRDSSVFSKAFIEEMKKIGFEEKTSESLSDGKKSRFSLIKISGRLPVDRIESLLSNPFVFKISPNL